MHNMYIIQCYVQYVKLFFIISAKDPKARGMTPVSIKKIIY